ncbi:MAG: gliding motility-associated C-terminal domain-containing protein [Chitinophagales bacterium]
MKQPIINICFIALFLAVLGTTHTFAQATYNMGNNTVTDCEGTLYDSGGPIGNYGPNENFTFTICPNSAPNCIRLSLGTVLVESNFDVIEVFDGMDNTAPQLLFHSTGLQTIADLQAYSGCITVVFSSDTDTQLSGWEANWSCFTEDCPEVELLPTEQDCLGAIPLCLGEYSETNSFLGEGNVLDEISKDNTCLVGGEKNSVWYTFTVLSSGDLGFTITPNDLNDDYDWAVFNITNAGCEEIPTNPSLLMSCNYSSTAGVTGATGATNQNSALGEDLNQNALIPVQENETYVINVSQFTVSPNGYTINFDFSTAVIFDDEPPSLEGAILCGANNLRLKLPENVFCSTVTTDDFELVGPDGSHTIMGVSSQACLDGAEYDRYYNLLFEPAIEVAGQYTLSLVGSIEDLCNNTSTNGTQLVFDISEADIRVPVEDLDVCEGDDLTLIINNPADTYNFYLDNSLDSLLGSGNQLDVGQYITAINTPFLFYITKVNDECSNVPTEVSVIVRDVGVANVAYDSPICFDENSPPALPTLSAESTQGGTFSISGGALIDAATGEIDISSTIAGNTYTITYSTPNSSCSVTTTADVSIVAPPTLTIQNLDNGYCELTGDIPLTATIAAAVFAGPGISNNSNIFNTNLAGIGTHEICATYTDPVTGCPTQDCRLIDVFSEPTAVFSVASSACIGEEVNIVYNGNANPNTATFTWNFGDGTQISGNDSNPVVQWTTVSTQTVSLTVEVGGNCSNVETQDIELVSIEVSNAAQDTLIRPDQSITLGVDASISNGNPLTYIWSPSDDLSCSNCPNPIASPNASTNYSVVISELNSNCSVSATYRVNVVQESRIAIPKAFSPNGDGFNDEFRISLRDFREAEFAIYDRSGNRVFESQNPTLNGWDGTYKFEPQNIGVYVYYLVVTFNNDDQRLYQGNLTLIR